MKICKHEGCFNSAAYKRNECNSCKHRAWKEKNRVRFTWHMIKKSAKKRSIPFFVPFKHFKKLIEESNYYSGSGRLGTDLTVDRIDNRKGYCVGNLQVISRIENIKKYHEQDKVEEDFPF